MPRKRNLARLALAPALAPTLALALALALAPPVRAYGPGPAGSRLRGLLYKAELLCSSN
jgi:hypothetical protein